MAIFDLKQLHNTGLRFKFCNAVNYDFSKGAYDAQKLLNRISR
jgi:hypothetical protein